MPGTGFKKHERSDFIRTRSDTNKTPRLLPLGTTNAKTLTILLAMMPVILAGNSLAWFLGPNLPEGKEINEPHLVRLFAPEFSYESIKVIETKEGKRYVIVKAKEKLDEKAQNEYQFNTLASRNIEAYSWGSEYSKKLFRSELVLYRIISEKPYVVDYSVVEGSPLENKVAQQ